MMASVITAEPMASTVLQDTMGFRGSRHRRTAACVQCVHALLPFTLKRLQGKMPHLDNLSVCSRAQGLKRLEEGGHEQILDHRCDGCQISCPHLQGAYFHTLHALFATEELCYRLDSVCDGVKCREYFESCRNSMKGMP